jgi:hypothetical protein
MRTYLNSRILFISILEPPSVVFPLGLWTKICLHSRILHAFQIISLNLVTLIISG